MASSSSSRNWEYDVFLSFRGKDVRSNFRSHLLKELDKKLINAFKDNKMMRSMSLWPELEKAIRNSRIALVIFSENYASSRWCLNELLEIMNCKAQNVIPVFYRVDPSDVKGQKEDFGRIFEETCKGESEEKKSQWKAALTNVAEVTGYDSKTWNDETEMIEDIANVVLKILRPYPSRDFERFVGLEDYFAKMRELLQLESEEVKMVGIWGSSGIGKTIIARYLFYQLSENFDVKKFIDKGFVNESKNKFCGANPDDYNLKVDLLKNLLSEILGKEGKKIDQLGAAEERLKHRKVLLIIDDLDDLMVLETLVGNLDWFGSGSRIIVVTKDRKFLRSHKIDLIYKVSLPTEDHAIEMLCQSAFNQKSPPDGFREVVVKVVKYVGRLPIALTVLGRDLGQMEKEYWIDKLPIEDGEYSEIEKVLKLSYDGLGSGNKTLFRYIACYFNNHNVEDIMFFLRHSNLRLYSGLKDLEDKSLIHVRTSTRFFVEYSYVEMHCLLQEMGKKIGISGEREFLVDSKDIWEVLSKHNGTQKVLAILWHIHAIDLSHFHEISFKGISKLRYLKVDFPWDWDSTGKFDRLILPERLDYLPPTLELLCWSFYPLRYIASGFSPENLVKLEMMHSKLEELWEGVVPLSGLRSMNLHFSRHLKKIPNLSKATNLEELNFNFCWSLVELPLSIQYLNKLLKLDMGECTGLKSIPTGFILKSLKELNFSGCIKLTTFPEFSSNVSVLRLSGTLIKEIPSNWYPENLVEFSMGNYFEREESDEEIREESDEVEQLTPFKSPSISNLVELPYSFKNLQSLKVLNLKGCSRLKSFPDISTNIEELNLNGTGIEEVPPKLIETFSRLKSLSMKRCKNLRHVSFNISKLKNLIKLKFQDCRELTRVDMCGQSFSPPYNCVPKAKLDFRNCYNLDPESLLHQHQLFMFKSMILPGKEVPSYFTHKTIGTSSPLAIPLLNIPHSQPFFRVKICVVLNSVYYSSIKLHFQFKGEFGKCYYCCACSSSNPWNDRYVVEGSHLYIFDCCLPRYKDNAPVDQRNYDHVNMKIHVDDDIIYNPQFGILLSEYGEDSYDSDMDLVTENGEEYRKNGDSDTDHKTKNGEETEDSNIDRAKQGANPATQLPISKKRDSMLNLNEPIDADEDAMLNLNEPIEECGEKHKKPRKVSKD